MGFLPGSFQQRLPIGINIVDLHTAFQRFVLCEIVSWVTPCHTAWTGISTRKAGWDGNSL